MSILGSWRLGSLIWYCFWVPFNTVRLVTAVGLAYLGHPCLEHRAGMAYMDYRAGEGAMASAAKWFERAARGGHARSQFEIGLHYSYGFGVAQDFAKAEHWLRLAHQNGILEAGRSLDGMKYLKDLKHWRGHEA